MTDTAAPDTAPDEEFRAELRGLVARIEQMLEVPIALASTDASGNPSLVAAGELIESAWGNAVAGRVVKRFANIAARDAAYPAATAGIGALCVTTDTITLWVSNGTSWIVAAPGLVGYVATNVIQNVGLSGTDLTGLSVSVNLSPVRRYRAIASVVVRKRGAAGMANLFIIVGVAGQQGGALDQIALDEYSTLVAISKPFTGSGATTIKLQGLAGSGSVDYNAATFDSLLEVFDIGPLSS